MLLKMKGAVPNLHGAIHLPDLPGDATAELGITIRAKSEHAALAVIEAFGGFAAWSEPHHYGGSTEAWMSLLKEEDEDGARVMLYVPTGAQPAPRTPFLDKLKEERAAALGEKAAKTNG